MALSTNNENKFVPANRLSDEELIFAEVLRDDLTRNLSITVKSSGGILATDLIRKSGTKANDVEVFFDEMSRNNLLAREYVVICSKSSNQINKVDSKEKIDKMAELGILCSCGRPIQNEKIQELYSPTPLLRRMLDQSYWMTAKLVSTLKGLNISENRILLNLQEGAEEVDAFADIDGSLLMFELKDNEFSMGHAYPFSGRIGLYRPEYAIIVSTKGISPDVREYFSRVKPGAKIVYIGNLSELESNLERIISQIRSARAEFVLSLLEPIASTSFPLTRALVEKFGIESRASTRRAVTRRNAG